MFSASTAAGPMNTDETSEARLVYLCALLAAVNTSCRKIHDIQYASGDSSGDRRLNTFQVFLTKLALICDNERGGDTITALVALKAANGPGYYFVSNNRKESGLEETKTFLLELLDYVGRNPDNLADRAFQKQVLWRILEFNYPRVDFYVRSVVTASSKCIEQCDSQGEPPEPKTVQQLTNIREKAKFPRDLMAGANAKPKFLKDCEDLIKAIQFSRDSGFSKEIDKRADDDRRPTVSLPWLELRHALARLHAYRHAAEVIIAASHEWPALFLGYSVNYIPSARVARFTMPKPTPSLDQVIRVAFPDMDLREYQNHIAQLRTYDLEENVQREMRSRTLKRIVHCEVLLQDMLIRNHVAEPSDYWRDSMFIATSKPPCRLCHYFFDITESDFEIQSSHMNVYPKWRLPDLYRDSSVADYDNQQVLLEDIIERMQHDILRIVKEKLPEGTRNDSRTDSRTGSSTMAGYGEGERSNRRTADWISRVPTNQTSGSSTPTLFPFRAPSQRDMDDHGPNPIGRAR